MLVKVIIHVHQPIVQDSVKFLNVLFVLFVILNKYVSVLLNNHVSVHHKNPVRFVLLSNLVAVFVLHKNLVHHRKNVLFVHLSNHVAVFVLRKNPVHHKNPVHKKNVLFVHLINHVVVFVHHKNCVLRKNPVHHKNNVQILDVRNQPVQNLIVLYVVHVPLVQKLVAQNVHRTNRVLTSNVLVKNQFNLITVNIFFVQRQKN